MSWLPRPEPNRAVTIAIGKGEYLLDAAVIVQAIDRRMCLTWSARG